MNDIDEDIDKRLKRAESGILWCNILMGILCIGLLYVGWSLLSFQHAQITFNEGVIEIFNSLKVK